tara:strand:- start:671 stop:1015 length:345 start_codon:yes stop_codon:yes gene_type:complete
MYASVLQFKFTSLNEAKIASGYISEGLGGKIAEFDFHGLNIMLGKSGEVTVTVRFEDAQMLKKFEANSVELIGEVSNAFPCSRSKFSGVCVYNFEREAISSTIELEGPIQPVIN